MIGYGIAYALVQMQIAEAERLADASLLDQRLKHAPPEEHPRIRTEHAAYIEKRTAERTAERRHRELCDAIRDAGRSAGRRSFFYL